MLTVTLTACEELGLTVSKANTDITRLKTKGAGNVSFAVAAVGRECNQPTESVYSRGAISKYSGLGDGFVRLVLRASACFWRCNIEMAARAFARG